MCSIEVPPGPGLGTTDLSYDMKIKCLCEYINFFFFFCN